MSLAKFNKLRVIGQNDDNNKTNAIYGILNWPTHNR